MRTNQLFTTADASTQQISTPINLDQRTWWKLKIDSASLDGTPQLFIEEAYTKSKTVAPVSGWTLICNPINTDDYFPLDDADITIEKKDIKGNWFRVRIEAADNTTGTVTILLAYKTFV